VTGADLDGKGETLTRTWNSHSLMALGPRPQVVDDDLVRIQASRCVDADFDLVCFGGTHHIAKDLTIGQEIYFRGTFRRRISPDHDQPRTCRARSTRVPYYGDGGRSTSTMRSVRHPSAYRAALPGAHRTSSTTRLTGDDNGGKINSTCRGAPIT